MLEINPNFEPIRNYKDIISGFTLIDGPVAEFGVYNGGMTKILAALDRPVWAFDTFEGMPYQEYYNDDYDSSNPPGKFRPDHDVIGFLNSLGNVVVQKGRFVDTLPNIPKDLVFSLVFLDCDYYLSHWQVFNYLEQQGHTAPGTIYLFDDYDLAGARAAIDEWRGTRKFTHIHNYAVVTI